MLGAGSFIPMIVTRLPIGLRAQEHTRLRQFQSLIGVNPLQTTWLERGTVSGRVALLLRSAEIQPLFGRFVRLDLQGSNHSLPGGVLVQELKHKPALPQRAPRGSQPFLAFRNCWIPPPDRRRCPGSPWHLGIRNGRSPGVPGQGPDCPGPPALPG